MKYVLILTIFIHGLIHLMGFAKAFNYAEISQLTQSISKPGGMLWLTAAVLFVLSAVLFFMGKTGWWWWAAPAVVLSQILIFTSWQDAKYGTVANLIVTIGIMVGFGQWEFSKLVNNELKTFLAQGTTEATIVTEEDIVTLPPIVQTWLRRSKVIGKPATSTVHLHQTGQMRTSPVRKWMDVQAEQFFNTDPPGFIWTTRVKMPLLALVGRDKYMNGKGHMLIKALGLIPVADSRSFETDQGTMVRYLSEIVWFPSAALENYFCWDYIDDTSAKATMTYDDMTVSGIFHFTPAGDMLSFDADRHYDRNGKSTLEHWHIETKAWGEPGGVRIPTSSEVTWRLKEGDFTWFKVEIKDIAYNQLPHKS